MAVSHDDVRAVAALARIAVADDQLDRLVAELNGILSHMDALARVGDSGAGREADEQVRGMRLSPDEGPPVALERAPEKNAPEWRDGFFLVPRLASHAPGPMPHAPSPMPHQ